MKKTYKFAFKADARINTFVLFTDGRAPINLDGKTNHETARRSQKGTALCLCDTRNILACGHAFLAP